MMALRNLLLVGAGGAVGAMMRYGVTLLCVAWQCSATWGTLMVNVVGSFAIGLLTGSVHGTQWLLFATVGLCGGFTTFSTFSMQTLALLQSGQYGQAVLYAVGTGVACVFGAALGVWLTA